MNPLQKPQSPTKPESWWQEANGLSGRHELQASLQSLLDSLLGLLPSASGAEIYVAGAQRQALAASRWNRDEALGGVAKLLAVRDRSAEQANAESGHESEASVYPLPDGGFAVWVECGLGSTADSSAVLCAFFDAPPDLPDSDQRLLRVMCEQAARTIEGARLVLASRRQLKELGVLQLVATEGAQAIDEDSLIERVTHIIGAELFPDNFGVMLLDEVRGVLSTHESYQGISASDRQVDFPLNQGVTGSVAASGQPVRLGDVARHPAYVELDSDACSEVCVPLMVGQRVIGVINAESDRADAFSEADERLLLTVAGQLAIAVDRLRSEAAQRRARLKSSESRAILFQVSRDLSGSLDPEQVYSAAHRAVAQLMPSEAFLIALLDAEHERIELVYAVDRSGPVAPLGVPREGSLMARVLDSRVTLRLDHMNELGDSLGQHIGDSEHVKSLVAAPMLLGERAFGVLSAQSYQTAAYTADDEQMLSLLANHAAVAIEHARLFAAEREQRQLAQVLRETGAILGASLNLETVLDQLLEQVARVVPYDTGTILMEEGDVFRVARLAGYGAQGSAVVSAIGSHVFERAGTATLRQIVASRQPLIVPDTREFDGWVIVPESAHIRSWIGAPMLAQGEVIAVFALDKTQPGYYQARHAVHLATFAGQAALAVQNARLFEAQRRRVAALTALHEIGLDVSQQLELSRLLRIIVERAARLLGAASGGLYLTQPDGTLDLVVSLNPIASLSGTRLAKGQGLAGWVAQLGQGQFIGNYSAWQGRAPEFDNTPLESVIGVPIKWQGRVIGVLVSTDPRIGVFGRDDLELLNLFAAQAGVAIANARLYADVRGQATELGHLFVAAQAMSASRDPGQVFDLLAYHLAEAMRASSAWVFEADMAAKTLVVLAGQAGADSSSQAADVPTGLEYKFDDHPRMASALANGGLAELHVDDPRLAPGERALLARLEAQSSLIVPLVARGQVLGAAQIFESGARRAFSARERRLAQTLGGQAADVIESARLLAALESEKRRLELLYGLSQRLTASLDQRELSILALDLVREALQVDIAAMYVSQTGEADLRLLAVSGALDSAGADARYDPNLPLGIELAIQAAASRLPIVVPDLGRSSMAADAGGAYPAQGSAGAAALRLGGDLLGAYVVISSRPGRLTAANLPTLAAIAAPMALAMQNAQLFEAETSRVRHLALLNDITRVGLSALDFQTLLNVLVERITALLNADAGCLTLWNAERRESIPAAAAGQWLSPDVVMRPWPGQVTLTETVLKSGRALLVVDAAASPYIDAEVAALWGAKTILALPLAAGDRKLGAAVFAFSQSHTLHHGEIERAEQAAGQVALAIAKAQLLDETKRRADELSLLVETSATLRAARSSEDMLPIFLQRASQVAAAVASSIYLAEPETGDLVLRACHPPDPRLTGLRNPHGQGITGKVAATGQMHISNRVAHNPVARTLSPALADFLSGVGSSIALPLRTQDDVVGVMHVGAADSHVFADNEIHLLTTIAEMAGSALHRADLLATLEQRVEQRTLELARANERLRALDILKDQFVSNVSHELRTPLTNIKLHLGLLERRGGEALERYLPTLQRETERLRRLIEDLLNLSQLQAQVTAPARSPHVMDALVAEVIGLHATRAEARRLALEHIPQTERLSVDLDRAQILQVLTNLVGNAVAYTPPGGRVRVLTTGAVLDGVPGVLVEVNNQGVVIPPDDLPHLFERFFRGRNGLESGEAGTGLGLAICKEIVDQHGGRVDASSSLAAGTTFSMWLPRKGP